MIEFASGSRYYAPSKDDRIALAAAAGAHRGGGAISSDPLTALDEAHELCSRYKRPTADTGQLEFACGS
jgi:hypothetical protein